MTQTPEIQNMLPKKYITDPPNPGDEIVITGMSGSFPDCRSVEELQNKLFEKTNLMTNEQRRWKIKHPNLPEYSGNIHDIEKFDANFFAVHFKQANSMDPACRILLERACEAVIDAGYNPCEFKNTNTAVFIGSSLVESERDFFYEDSIIDGLGTTGNARCMQANRISFWLGCTGPSYSVDSGCSSGLYVLQNAYNCIRSGICDAAIIGTTNLCLLPSITIQFSKLGRVSPDGLCRAFDENANGYGRSEAVSVIILQKLKNARRTYAELKYVKLNHDGHKLEGILHPISKAKQSLLANFYKEIDEDPEEVEYVETFGSGIPQCDEGEIDMIDSIFCKKRKDVLKIGTIKSNLGHAECSSAMCSIVKACIAYNTGYIPPNINYTNPNPKCKALIEKRIEVVTEKTPWNRGKLAINSFSLAGINGHALLQGVTKEKVNGGLPCDNAPRLVFVSGRTEKGVQKIIQTLESKPVDVEVVKLLHGIHENEIFGHTYRGYTILKNGNNEMAQHETKHYNISSKRPVWFIFAGMGSQWPGMATDMLELPLFAESIHMCCKIMESKGVDLMKIIKSTDPKTFDNVLNSFIGIAAIQIALVDTLAAIGVKADHIIGHSVGELGCAYADGCMTREETILTAYSRGLISNESNFIKGLMAAIGIGSAELSKICPPEIEIACRNSKDNCTISGPAEDVKSFVQILKERGIFAKVVPTGDIAYHSRYISRGGPPFKKYLEEIIPVPRKRSSKWIASSVPADETFSEKHRYSSPEYHTGNLLNPVYFEDASKHIQPNSITIEIAPHGLLQAILKRSLSQNCSNLALTNRNSANNLDYFLNTLGRLYNLGLNMNLANLYPKVEYPVSTGTPMLSNLVEWEHSDDWFVSSFIEKRTPCENKIQIAVMDEDNEYLFGNMITGHTIYPSAGYLYLVWEILNKREHSVKNFKSVIFENVNFLNTTIVPKDHDLEFVVMLSKGTGSFGISYNNSTIVTGKIYIDNEISKSWGKVIEDPNDEKPENKFMTIKTLSNEDIYKEFCLRDHQYGGLFRGINQSNLNITKGSVFWQNNWITYLESIMQYKILNSKVREPTIPVFIEKMCINYEDHMKYLEKCGTENGAVSLPISFHPYEDIILSGGVQIHGLRMKSVAKIDRLNNLLLEKHSFIPYFSTQVQKVHSLLNEIIHTNIQIILENSIIDNIKCLEIMNSTSNQPSEPILLVIADMLKNMSHIQNQLILVSENPVKLNKDSIVNTRAICDEKHIDLYIDLNIFSNEKKLNDSWNILNNEGYIITLESSSKVLEEFNEKFNVITEYATEYGKIIMIRKKPEIKNSNTEVIEIKSSDRDFIWIEEVKSLLKNNKKVTLISQNNEYSGIMGVAKLLKEDMFQNKSSLNIVYIVDASAPKFDLNLDVYKNQLDKNLILNVLQDNNWGTYKKIPLNSNSTYPTEHAYCSIMKGGNIQDLQWVEGPLNSKDDEIIHVHYASINPIDVLTIIGDDAIVQLNDDEFIQERPIGLEYSGKLQNGDAVMGLVKSKALSNILEPDQDFTWPIPSNWSIEDGATVPYAYITALYALNIIGNMKHGESVLIHDGADAIGQACINVCLSQECEIFTTGQNEFQRKTIQELFPKIPDSHIGSSSDTTFENMVMRETHKKGVHLVINTLTGEGLYASTKCTSLGGHFVQVGYSEEISNTEIGMGVLRDETSISGVITENIFKTDQQIKNHLNYLMKTGIQNGSIKPLTRKVYDITQLNECIIDSQEGKISSKALIKIRNNELCKPSTLLIPAMPKYIITKKLTFIIVGEMDCLSVELANWLISQGAKNIVLNSKMGITNGYQALRIKFWTSHGVNVIINTDDVSSQEGCISLLKTASEIGPVTSIFNLSSFFQNTLSKKQPIDDFCELIDSFKHLDMESKRLCPHLTDLVVFLNTSIGQNTTNIEKSAIVYSIIERMCENRRKYNFPAIAIRCHSIDENSILESNLLKKHFVVLQQILKSKQSTVYSISRVINTNLLDTVATILHYKNTHDVPINKTFKELGITKCMEIEMSEVLQQFKIKIRSEDLQSLTFSKLENLTESHKFEMNNFNIQNIKDLSFFFKNINSENDTKKSYINMNTLANGENSTKNLVFLIPGMEGTVDIFTTLCKRLKHPVVGLQLPYDNSYNTVENSIRRFVDIIKLRLSHKDKFTIVGYSYGSLLALEVIKTLEAEGFSGNLVLIDSSPEYIKKCLSEVMSSHDDENLQNTLLYHCTSLINPNEKSNIFENIKESNTFKEKVDTFSSLENSKHSKPYLKSFAESMYKRVKIALNFADSFKNRIKSPTTLIKSSLQSPITIADNYGLDKYIDHSIEILYLDENHRTIIDNKKCANIINNLVNSTNTNN